MTSTTPYFIKYIEKTCNIANKATGYHNKEKAVREAGIIYYSIWLTDIHIKKCITLEDIMMVLCICISEYLIIIYNKTIGKPLYCKSGELS